MKKYLLSLLAVAAVVGCTTFEDEASIAVVNAADPIITLNTVEDTGFTATVAAQAGTGFYSFAVLAGAPKDLDPSTLLKVGVKNTLVAGTVDYSKNPSKVIEMTELARNTVYTVYAVAASEQGTVGNVVSMKVTTPDGENPSAKSVSFADGVFTVTFSEPVTYTGKAATANYYAINTPSGATYNIGEDKPVGSVPVTVEASGDKATFTLGEGVPNGAYIALSYPKGAFEDAVSNPIAAMESGFYTNDEGKLATKGITSRQPVVNFDLEIYGGEPVVSVSSLVSPIWIAVPEDYIHFKAVTPANGGGEGYSIVYEGETETHTYTQAGMYDYGWNGTYNCALAYPNAYSGRPDPTPGQNITITIPEGFLTDIYGNTNNVFVIGPFLYSYGYEMEDVYGTYVLKADTQYCGTYEHEGIIIAPAPADEEDYKGMDVIIYNLFEGTPCCDDLDSFSNFNTPFGATFNLDSGVLQFGWYDAIGTGSIAQYEWSGYVLALCMDTEDYCFSFQMPQKGTLVLSETVAVFCNGLGTWDRYRPTTTTLVKVSDEYSLPEAAPMPRKAQKAHAQDRLVR